MVTLKTLTDYLESHVNNQNNDDIVEILDDLYHNRLEFEKLLQSVLKKPANKVHLYSHETATHYKWHIYTNQQQSYRLWLHEYKKKDLVRFGYATVPHNHRYSFASLILRGGFKHELYQIERIPNNHHTFKNLSLLETSDFELGKIYTIDSNQVHSLSNIQDDTLTFIVERQSTRDYSEEFDLKNKQITRHFSFEWKIAQLVSKLALS